jgi:hypothetical protein
MSWRDSQRLTGLAHTVRRAGWLLFALLVLAVTADAAASDGGGSLLLIGVAAVAGAAVLGVTHAIAWLMDRRAERVVTR